VPTRALETMLRRYGPFKAVGVALSGGGDSVALLHAMAAVGKKRDIKVTALHVHHGLRPEADQEAKFCEDLSDRLGADFIRLDLDPKNFRGNTHDAARRARYEAMEKAASERGLQAVLTGHTLDDQAETLIQRFMRGSGPDGLAGIREKMGMFIRPWLTVRREQLREYLREHELDWCEDPSNEDPRYLRSRIRKELMPVMEEVGGNKVLDALGRLAQLSDQQRAVLDELAQGDLAAMRRGEGLDVEKLASLSEGRRAMVLRAWLAQREIVPPMGVIADLDRMVVASGPHGPFTLPGGVNVYRDYDALNWGAPAVVQDKWEPFAAGQPVDCLLAEGALHLRVGPNQSVGKGQTFAVDPAQMAECAWQPVWPGARFSPRGMAGNVKCRDLFVNEKIPQSLREHWPILTQGEEILLVAGLRAAKQLREPNAGGDCWFVQLEW